MTSRNQIYRTLFELGKSVTWASGGAFVTASRKWKEIENVPPIQRPAFYQIEPVESVVRQRNTESKTTFDVRWVVYIQTDPNDDDDVGADALNDIIDALMAAIDPGQNLGMSMMTRQTLGSLVEDAWIEGDIVKLAGDDTGGGMLVIQIKVLVP